MLSSIAHFAWEVETVEDATELVLGPDGLPRPVPLCRKRREQPSVDGAAKGDRVVGNREDVTPERVARPEGFHRGHVRAPPRLDRVVRRGLRRGDRRRLGVRAARNEIPRGEGNSRDERGERQNGLRSHREAGKSCNRCARTPGAEIGPKTRLLRGMSESGSCAVTSLNVRSGNWSRWAPAAWAKCTRAATPAWNGPSRLRSYPRRWRPTPRGGNASTARPESSPRSAIPTFVPSSTWAATNGVDFLVMEYLEGETLSGSPRSRSTACSIWHCAMRSRSPMRSQRRIVQAYVTATSSQGNVMLTRSGARLLDFGLAEGARLVHTLGDRIRPRSRRV